MIKYKQHLYSIIFLIKNYVEQVFKTAAEQAAISANSSKQPEDKQIQPGVVSSDVAFSLYYGKFQLSASKVKPVIEQVEKRAEQNNE